MASGAEEAMGERSSVQAAAADSQCPICLGDIRKAAYVAYCMHGFCFACIRRWARGSDECPVCRQPLEQLLHTVRGDNDYQEYVLGLPARLRRRMAVERARSQSPQRHCSLGKQPANNHPWACRSGPSGIHSAQRQGAAPSNATSQQAPALSACREPSPPSSSWEPTLPSAGKCPAAPAAALRRQPKQVIHLY